MNPINFYFCVACLQTTDIFTKLHKIIAKYLQNLDMLKNSY